MLRITVRIMMIAILSQSAFAWSLTAAPKVPQKASQKSSVECTLEAINPKGSDGLVTSIIFSGKAVNDGKSLVIKEVLNYAKKESILLTVQFSPETSELKADIREYGSKGSTFWFFYGVGNGSFSGKLAYGSQEVRLTAPIKGTIENEFLKDREDKSLVDFAALALVCKVSNSAPMPD
jgi:hypothetical protein